MPNHLDLGCGTNPQNPYRQPNLFGIDIRDDAQALLAQRGITIKKANLVFDKIPFEDNFFALALPPLRPPKRPKATAAGLLFEQQQHTP